MSQRDMGFEARLTLLVRTVQFPSSFLSLETPTVLLPICFSVFLISIPCVGSKSTYTLSLPSIFIFHSSCLGNGDLADRAHGIALK